MLPKKQGMVTVRAPEFSFVCKTVMKIEEFTADFTFDLRTFFPIVEV